MGCFRAKPRAAPAGPMTHRIKIPEEFAVRNNRQAWIAVAGNLAIVLGAGAVAWNLGAWWSYVLAFVLAGPHENKRQHIAPPCAKVPGDRARTQHNREIPGDRDPRLPVVPHGKFFRNLNAMRHRSRRGGSRFSAEASHST